MRKESRREHNPVRASSGRALEKAERLAPAEERAGKNNGRGQNNGGVMVVDSAGLKLPKDLAEDRAGEREFMGLDRVALTILILSLAFIAFIAYLISVEPTQK